MSQDNLEYSASSPTYLQKRKYIMCYSLRSDILVENPFITQESEVRISDCRLSAYGVVQSTSLNWIM